MRSAIGEWYSSNSGGQNHTRILVLLSFLVVTGDFGQAFSKSTIAYEPAVTINVLVYNYARVSFRNLDASERLANNILSRAGVQAVWVDCLTKVSLAQSKELCQNEPMSQAMGLRLLPGHVTNQFQDSEFGFANIPLYATISYEHVVRRAGRDGEPLEIPILLGAVIAHELGHLLLADPSHSAIGIMQATWGTEQIHQAWCGRLLFTPEQAELIHTKVRLMTSRSAEERRIRERRLPANKLSAPACSRCTSG